MNDPGAGTAPVPFSGAITQAQYRDVTQALLPWWGRWYAFLVYCVLGFIGLGTGWGQALDKPVSVLIDVVEGVVVFAACMGMMRWQAKRNWQTYTRLHGSVAGQVGDAGLEWKTESTTSAFGWGKLLGFKVVGDIALVYYAPRCAFFLPRSFFASDADWQALQLRLARHLKAL